MHHFFADPTQVAEDTIFITGPDVNHMKHVLRMKPGEEVLISDGTGRDYTCEVEAFEPDRAVVRIHSVCDSRMELPAEIWLFQGLPKADKMELIIQKAVELGASAVVPVATKNAVVRLEGAGQEKALAGHCGKCSQAVKAQQDPPGGAGDDLKRGIFLCS